MSEIQRNEECAWYSSAENSSESMPGTRDHNFTDAEAGPTSYSSSGRPSPEMTTIVPHLSLSKNSRKDSEPKQQIRFADANYATPLESKYIVKKDITTKKKDAVPDADQTHEIDFEAAFEELHGHMSPRSKQIAKLAFTNYNMHLRKPPRSIFVKIALSDWFELVALVVIILNALWMGIEVDAHDTTHSRRIGPMHVKDTKSSTTGAGQTTTTESSAKIDPFLVVENVFCIFFTMELFIRFMSYRKLWYFFVDPDLRVWNMFDLVLVMLIVVENWILSWALADEEDTANLGALSALRLLRLMRITRLFALVPELGVMVKSIAAAARSVSSTIVLVLGLMYVYAIVFTQWAKSRPEFNGEDNPNGINYFGQLGWSFLSLMQILIFDDTTKILRAVYLDSPPMGLMLILFMLIGGFTVLNQLIGVICEVVSTTKSDEEEKVLIKKMEQAFYEMDENGDGTLTRDEVEKNNRLLHTMLGLDVKTLKLAMDLLEDNQSDSSEGIDVETFVQIVMSLLQPPNCQDLLVMKRNVAKLCDFFRVDAFDKPKKDLNTWKKIHPEKKSMVRMKSWAPGNRKNDGGTEDQGSSIGHIRSRKDLAQAARHFAGHLPGMHHSQSEHHSDHEGEHEEHRSTTNSKESQIVKIDGHDPFNHSRDSKHGEYAHRSGDSSHPQNPFNSLGLGIQGKFNEHSFVTNDERHDIVGLNALANRSSASSLNLGMDQQTIIASVAQNQKLSGKKRFQDQMFELIDGLVTSRCEEAIAKSSFPNNVTTFGQAMEALKMSLGWAEGYLVSGSRDSGSVSSANTSFKPSNPNPNLLFLGNTEGVEDTDLADVEKKLKRCLVLVQKERGKRIALQQKEDASMRHVDMVQGIQESNCLKVVSGMDQS